MHFPVEIDRLQLWHGRRSLLGIGLLIAPVGLRHRPAETPRAA